jgi:hypothetical protein
LRSHVFCPRVSVAIRGVDFSANLMVLDTKGIDVILGMETLAKWGVRIDCAQRTVLLSAPDGQGVTAGATEPSGFLHQMEARPTDGIHVVSEFPMSFRMICQVCRLIATLSFLLISCLAQLL